MQRSPYILLIGALCAAACGAEGLMAKGYDDHAPPSVCDLQTTAAELIGAAGTCPPERVQIDAVTGELLRLGSAGWSDDQACTQFEIIGAGCHETCAPALCHLEDDVVVCDTTCSRDLITCFIVPESACP